MMENRKSRIARGMQLALILMTLYGLLTGSTKVVINSFFGLLVTVMPAVMERNYEVYLSPWLSLWITSAVFLHAAGSSGLYSYINWWDHVTHALSASVVAGIGYTFIRSIEIHSDKIKLPRNFMFIFILMTVIAFGVTWELFEYGLDIFSNTTGIVMPLAQHGLEDTMKDMMFNTAGAALVALFGQAYLSDLAQQITEKLKERP